MALRTEKTRLLKNAARRQSSTRWLQRQLNDPYVQMARRDGYRARSVYKLKELDERFGLIRPGATIADLGAAPGSWSQYAAGRNARVVAIDLLAIDAIAGVTILQGDFLDEAVQARLKASLGGPIELVLSDIAADATGKRTVDRLRAEAVGESVIAFAGECLAPGGQVLLKLVKGAEAGVGNLARRSFRTIRILRPKATRSESSEIFLLASGFKADGDG